VAEDAWQRRLAELRAAIAAHPGAQAHSAWEELRRMVELNRRNTLELQHLLESARSNFDLAVELIQNVGPEHKRVEFYAQLDQRLHNMLSSATTLVDHTRRLIQKYEGSDLASEFELRNTAVKNAQVSQFLRRFRNYLLHVGMAPLGATLSMKNVQGGTAGHFESKVELEVLVLLRWDDWTAGSLAYMHSAGDKIDLYDAVRDYAALTDELTAWLFTRFESLHGKDVNAINELIGEYNQILSGGGARREAI